MGVGYDRYWEMKEGGPYDAGNEIFKCKDCGAETFPTEGHDGEPDPGHCREGCSSRDEDWAPGRVSRVYKRNFDGIFPDALGAGV
jgi:hypothetical protein